MSYQATAGVINITPESFNNWMNWGKTGDKDPIYCRFYALVRESESQLMKSCMQKIKISAETGNIDTVKWLLERKWPQEFGKQSQVNMSAKTESLSLNVNANIGKNETEKIRSAILAKLTPRNLDSEIKQLRNSSQE